MWREKGLLQTVLIYLPPDAELLIFDPPCQEPAVAAFDLDGNGILEIIAGYRRQKSIYLMILKYFRNGWRMAGNLKGKGYTLSFLQAAPVTGRGKTNLLIGWQSGSNWSELAIYEWVEGGLQQIPPNNTDFSKIEVTDMPGLHGKDGQAELALWLHDTGEAYKVEVYRWKNGGLVPAHEVYPYYFTRVAKYYTRKTKEHPRASFYWHYLADSQIKAGMPADALKSIDMALTTNYPYPSEQEITDLKKKILSEVETRVLHLYPASVMTANGVKWGYINKEGKFLIPPKLSDARNFQENGLAIVREKDGWGVIDTAGRYVVQPIYSTIFPYSEGRAIVNDDQGFKVINEHGRVLTGKPYQYIGSFQGGRALFSGTDLHGSYRYGYLDRQGREAIPLQYEAASNFIDGKAIVKRTDGQYALIKTEGQILTLYKDYEFAGNYGDGLIAFRKKNENMFGYMDEKGIVVIPARFTGTEPFREGRAIVNTAENYQNKYGIIDKSGRFLLKPEYNDVKFLGEQRAAVGKAIDSMSPFKGSMYALADVDGQIFTGFEFYDISNFKNGLASVYDAENTFFINKYGSPVKSLPVVSGSGTLSFENELIQANVDSRLSYFDRAGNVIWRQNTVFPLNQQYHVIEKKYKPNKDYLVYFPQIEGMLDKQAEKAVNKKLKELSQVKELGNVQLDSSYNGDFSVQFFKKDLLVFELNGYEYYFGAAHGMPTKVYPHIDLRSGTFYQLADLFKPESGYVAILSEIIGRQIKTNEKYSYVFPDTYKGIKADQPFYVGGDALSIYFLPYEIAPYAAGFPTFRIPFSEIDTIINKRGSFWQAFH